MLKNWTWFERIWLVASVAIITTLSIMWQDTWLGYVSSIAGILCVVMAAKGKMATFFFGLIQCTTYAYIAYGYQLYGEAMLNAFFYVPMQFIAGYFWYKNRKAKTERINGEDIYAKRLSKNQWFILTPIVIVSILLYGFLLISIGAQQPRLDSAAVVLSIVAQFLMLFRYAEQWLLWISVNVLTIALWVVTLVNSGGNDWTILAMWVAFLVNSVYGWLNWRKISAPNKNNETDPLLDEKVTATA